VIYSYFSWIIRLIISFGVLTSVGLLSLPQIRVGRCLIDIFVVTYYCVIANSLFATVHARLCMGFSSLSC